MLLILAALFNCAPVSPVHLEKSTPASHFLVKSAPARLISGKITQDSEYAESN